ncbi:hypothetical protein BDU57DRAFT_524555 [Ampelomyces quisqualis]|uniref:Uncharacterized protein n=1 Tax=Ampelomyces quisqualis TaxID=50730 RepID=A0A6A5QAY2_AMPQU|nr:hypothetical protein BDU57DRAFT_524555 [Ampelomyces quisqualis]
MTRRAPFAEIPIHPDNWLPEPTTQIAFEEWMDTTGQLLKTWVQATHKDFNCENKIVKAFQALEKRNEEEWKKHEPNTDVQTGTIISSNRAEYKKMETAMLKTEKKNNKFHESHRTEYRHVLRTFADMAWEDFLYYQNVWNRKDFDPNQEFELVTTMMEDVEEMPPKTRSRGGKVLDSTKLGPEDINGPRYRPKAFSDPINAPDHELYVLFRQWNVYVITLYMRFKLGYRKLIPDVVDPEHAHRYSQPPRDTTASCHQERRQNLNIQFPRRKRTRPMVNGVEGDGDENERHSSSEVEEEYSSQSRIEMDERREARGQMEDIVWQIDDDAVRAHVRENDGKQAKSDPEYARPTKTRLLKAQHKTYHASKSSSFDWPTSFDSKDCGNTIALTKNKKEYLYEKGSDVKHLSDAEKARRSDASGRVRKIEKKPRYKMTPDANIKTTNVRVGKRAYSIIKPGETLKFDSDGRRRVALPPRFMFKRIYHVDLQAVSELGLTRKEQHEAANRMAELSESEDEGRLPTSDYYRQSGNENPGNIGKGPGYDDHQDFEQDDDAGDGFGAGGGTTGGEIGEEIEESDDEGDLFKQSYEEC